MSFQVNDSLWRKRYFTSIRSFLSTLTSYGDYRLVMTLSKYRINDSIDILVYPGDTEIEAEHNGVNKFISINAREVQ